MFRSAVISILMLISSVVQAESMVEYREGEDIRIRVPMITNLEKKVIFEEPVTLGLTTEFRSVFRLQSIGNTAYFTAKTASTRQIRISGKGLRTKRVYSLLLTVSQRDADADVIRVVSETKRKQMSGGTRKEVSSVDAVRFVAQTLFAPNYAIEPLLGARAVAHSLDENLDYLYEGSSLDISPIRAYRAGNWTVTALQVVNKSKHRNHPLDANALMRFYPRIAAEGVVSQFKYLGINESDNHSVVYVVTRGALVENLKVGR